MFLYAEEIPKPWVAWVCGPNRDKEVFASMADETKTNATPETPGGPPPPAPEQTGQAVIPGMDGGPAPSGKVIDLSDVRAEADKTGPESPPEQGAAGSVTEYTKQEWERPLEEIEAEQKKPRRGRPPKADRAAPEAGEKKPGRGRAPKAKAAPSGKADKHNCTLRRLDWQQEQGYMSSLPLAWNGIEIQRGMTTSSTAIFIPFMTKELRMDGQALYYGMNALSNNVIMADRKRLKNPNGMFLGTPGSGKSFAAKREIVNVFLTWPEDDIVIADPEGNITPSSTAWGDRW